MLSLVNYCEERYSKFDIRFKDLNNKELEDCKRFYENGKRMIVNDGRIVYIVEEEE